MLVPQSLPCGRTSKESHSFSVLSAAHREGWISRRARWLTGTRTLVPAVLGVMLLLPHAHGGLTKSSSPARNTSQAPSPPSGPRVRATKETTVYWSPAAVRPRRAIVAAGSVVVLDSERRKPGSGCRADWAAVAGGGFLCMEDVEMTKEPIRSVPTLVDDLLPFTYVHRLDTKAYSYAFLPGQGTGHKQLFRRGRPLDESRYTRHTPSRFHGRNLERSPVANRDLVPGWTVSDEAPLYPTPSNAANPVRRLARHTPLLVALRQATPDWHEVWDADGHQRLGFMKDDERLRHWVGAAPVEGLAPGETWLDIDVGQQMIAMRTFGTGPIYITLISSGLAERPSPLGVFHMDHKLAYRSMGNLPASKDQYFIENVPWTMYFLPEYAIHGAYWHDEFGNRRSHGCVNLAPRDARYIYSRVPPLHQPGFFKTFASDQAPGAVVRLRDSTPSRVAGRKHAQIHPES
jgi:hypothetical protein